MFDEESNSWKKVDNRSLARIFINAAEDFRMVHEVCQVCNDYYFNLDSSDVTMDEIKLKLSMNANNSEKIVR